MYGNITDPHDRERRSSFQDRFRVITDSIIS